MWHNAHITILHKRAQQIFIKIHVYLKTFYSLVKFFNKVHYRLKDHGIITNLPDNAVVIFSIISSDMFIVTSHVSYDISMTHHILLEFL